MTEASIPVDVFNPGQVFACVGFMEAAQIILGGTMAGFDCADGANVRFRLAARGSENPFQAVLSFLSDVEIRSYTPSDSGLTTEKWGVETDVFSPDFPFPFPLPKSPATLPVRLTSNSPAHENTPAIEIAYWGDDLIKTGRDNVKFWAGAAGYPGAALAKDAINLVREHLAESHCDPFSVAAEQSSSFRLDWRRDYIPLEIGFSLNKHTTTRFTMIGYPIVELLAAIGLTNARPEFVGKLEYRYGVICADRNESLFDPLFVRTAIGAIEIPFKQRHFFMKLGWPGKEGQSRCITNVFEEQINE